jgi:Flp pilus assembly protein TadB
VEIITVMLVFAAGAAVSAAVYTVINRDAEIKKLKGAGGLPTQKNILKEYSVSLRNYINSANKRFASATRYNSIRVLINRLDLEKSCFLENFIFNEEAYAIAGFAAGILIIGNIYAAIAVAFASFFIPDFILKAKSSRKKEEILREMPDAYDIIAAGIEGGLSASMALARYAAGSKGVFAAELLKAVKKTQLGENFETALKGMHEKNGIPELAGFVNAFIQAEKTGGNVKDAIRSQAVEIRAKRFMALKKKAYEAPVKLLIPLILFIFPVIFIILFGPIVLKLIKGF